MPGISEKAQDEALLFAGLGNPGDSYAGNRHNVGFMAADAMAQAHGFSSYRSKFQGLVAEGTIAGRRVVILKPLTFMNLSGQAVAAAARFFKINPERIVVFHDELDLEAGKVRVKRGGGNAGHNGLKSIQAHLGTPDFWRVRIGIGHPGEKERVHGHVLSDFSKADRVWVAALLESCARHAGMIVAGDMDGFSAVLGSDLKNCL